MLTNTQTLIKTLLLTGLLSVTFQAVASPNGSLLILGDSLSAGYGITLEKSWVSLLQQRLKTQQNTQNVEVINASISGETTSGGKNRLPALLQKYPVKWLVIELGANDALRGQNLKVSRQNIATMIELAQQKDIKVLLLGIKLPTNYGPAYDAQLQNLYTQLAHEYSVALDPFFLETVALEPDLMQADALHPNEMAQPKILERVGVKIEELLRGK